MPRANDLVLITGATGHLGFRTLRTALEYGFPVRAAVRSEAKAGIVKDTVQTLKLPGQLEFIVVPDFTTPNAFDEALKGVKHVIHIASPLATAGTEDDDLEELFIKSAVHGTLGLFEAAKRIGSVERIVSIFASQTQRLKVLTRHFHSQVVTSSVVAIHPLSAWVQPSDKTYTAEDRLDEISAPYSNRVVAYAAGKITALKRAEAFTKEQNPGFDAIHIMPSFILGRDNLCTSTERFMQGTNVLALSQALGIDVPQAPTRTNNFNSVEDCARVHVLSLDKTKVPGNQSFIVSNSGTDGMAWDDANEIVKRRFPKEVASEIFPANGKSQTVVCKLDVSKTEEVFGFKHASYEECVVGICEHYLEVLEREKGQI